jgi:hypothetical protein
LEETQQLGHYEDRRPPLLLKPMKIMNIPTCLPQPAKIIKLSPEDLNNQVYAPLVDIESLLGIDTETQSTA